MTYSGFQSSTTPRDTFVSQSTQPAINTQDSLSQVAQALQIIEPNLQKFIVKKILTQTILLVLRMSKSLQSFVRSVGDLLLVRSKYEKET